MDSRRRPVSPRPSTSPRWRPRQRLPRSAKAVKVVAVVAIAVAAAVAATLAAAAAQVTAAGRGGRPAAPVAQGSARENGQGSRLRPRRPAEAAEVVATATAEVGRSEVSATVAVTGGGWPRRPRGGATGGATATSRPGRAPTAAPREERQRDDREPLRDAGRLWRPAARRTRTPPPRRAAAQSRPRRRGRARGTACADGRGLRRRLECGSAAATWARGWSVALPAHLQPSNERIQTCPTC